MRDLIIEGRDLLQEASSKPTKARIRLYKDAEKQGYTVEKTKSRSVRVYKKHKGTGKVLRGIEIYEDGWAVDLTVDLSVSRMMRSYSDFREVLHLGK